jgi:hypothetical protein
MPILNKRKRRDFIMKDSIKKFYEMISSSEEMQKKIAELDKAFAEKHTAPSPDAGAVT